MACDIAIRNGTLVDGTGAPGAAADVAIADGRIVEIGQRLESGASASIDAYGPIVTPGLIDPHTHYDTRCSGIR